MFLSAWCFSERYTELSYKTDCALTVFPDSPAVWLRNLRMWLNREAGSQSGLRREQTLHGHTRAACGRSGQSNQRLHGGQSPAGLQMRYMMEPALFSGLCGKLF